MFTQPSAYTENLVLNQQRKTDLSGSAIKTLPATSFARRMKRGKLAKMRVVKNLLKSNYGRPFFVCSDQSNPCSFWVWGDVQHVAKPKCRRGFPW